MGRPPWGTLPVRVNPSSLLRAQCGCAQCTWIIDASCELSGVSTVAPQEDGRERFAPPPSVSAAAHRPHLDRVQHESMQRFDFGTAGTVPSPSPVLSTTVSTLGPLPPLPPLPFSSSPQSVSPHNLKRSHAPLAMASGPSHVSPLPPFPTLSSFQPAHLPSTPPEVPEAGSITMAAAAAAAAPDFDPCEFLNTSLALFQSGGGSTSMPTSPALVFPPLPPIAPAAPPQFACIAESFPPEGTRIRGAGDKLETVPEDEYDESLWSAGEDPLGSSAATDVMSEASWAW